MQRYDLDVSRLIEVFEKDKLNSIVKTHKQIIQKIQSKIGKYESVFPDVVNMEPKTLYYYITYVYMLESSFNIQNRAFLDEISEIAALIIEPFQNFVHTSYELNSELQAPEKNLIMQMGIFQGIDKLEKLIDNEGMAFFWKCFHKYSEEIIEGTGLFRSRHIGKIIPYDEYEEEKIAVGLNAHSKLILPMLAGLTGEFELVETLEESLNHYYIAHKQFLDLKCWKKDLSRNYYTPILTEVIVKHKMKKPFDESKIMQCLYGEKYDEKYLIEANRHIEKALFLCGDNKPCQRSLRSIQSRINLLLYDFRTLKMEPKRIFPYVEVKNHVTKEAILAQIKSTINWISNQKQGQFPELKYWAVFLHTYGFTGEEQIILGDTYYRAYFTNILNGLFEKNDCFNEDFFNMEMAYLKSQRYRYSDYGWGNFADLPDIPTDISTMAEMIMLATKIKDNEFLEEVNDLIDFIINKNRNKDGFINYWITGKSAEDFFSSIKHIKCIYARTMLKKMFINPMFVSIANFLLALHHYDAKRYENVINTEFEWLCHSQKEDGSWKGYYYTGNYNSIYHIMKLACALNKNNQTVKNALTYILKNQHENGAWGQVYGDPKETSYAILSLLEIVKLLKNNNCNESIKSIESALKKGVDYLINATEGKAYWHGVDIAEIQIKKISTEPADFIEYRSATLTTGLALSALDQYLAYIS